MIRFLFAVTPPVLKSFSQPLVAELAGPASYERGLYYKHDGRVELQSVRNGRVRAVVRGTMPYTVELWDEGGTPRWACSCPVGESGEFCKHCVAVALELLGDEPPIDWEALVDEDDAHLLRYLSGLQRDDLIDLVLDQAAQDRHLRDRLDARASTNASEAIDIDDWSRRVAAAFESDEFVGYSEAREWATDIHNMLDTLDELLEAGHSAAVTTLAEQAYRMAGDATQYVDDSGGWLSDLSERIADLHFTACEDSRPDPQELARRLVDLALTSELGGFRRAAADYAHLLGDSGIAEYRHLIEPQWRALTTGSDTTSTDRYRLTEAMVGIALATGDPEALIAVKREHLRTPDDYREISSILASAGRIEEAIEWGQKGLAAFPDLPWLTPPLREFIASLMRRHGDHDGALQVFWSAYESTPTLDAYRRLLREAKEQGSTGDWRQRALQSLRVEAAQYSDDPGTRRSPIRRTPASSLVQILLYEGEPHAAWEAATEFGCDSDLWLTLARAREKTHPLDSIPIYEREVEAQIAKKNNAGYQSAVDYLDRIRSLCLETGRPERFQELLSSIRTEHKPKRNLMALLGQKGW